MSAIYTSADQLIGKTPLLELTHIEKKLGLKAKVLAKLEYLNPAGSTATTFTPGTFSLRYLPTPVIVPPVPTPATK